MRQQASVKNSYGDLLAGENPIKFLFLEPTPLIDGIVSHKFRCKNNFFLNFGYTTSLEPGHLTAVELKDPRPDQFPA
jgi:hypothetical protein